MAKYSKFKYEASLEDGAKVYGEAALPSLSVAPFTAEVIDYDNIRLSWTKPQNGYRRVRILRNQEGIPDTEEDGLILLDLEDFGQTYYTDNGLLADGRTVPLIRGRHVYYSIWLWLGSEHENRWYLAGTVNTTVPSDHLVLTGTSAESTTHTRLLESLPRVFTSAELNSMGEVDYSSDIAQFLEGFSFTADQLMTLADLLLPNSSLVNLTPELLNAYGLNFGIKPENLTSDKPTKFQRNLVRNAMEMYSEKGTVQSLRTFIEAITGYPADVSLNPNLMLSAADATFYRGTGNWSPSAASLTLTSEATGGPADESVTVNEAKYRVDKNYVAKAIVTAANTSILNGSADAISTGIPVEPDGVYAFSLYQKSSATATITLGVSWYDMFGNHIADADMSDAFSATTGWTKIGGATVVAPASAYFASLSVTFSATGTYYLDMVNFAEDAAEDFTEARGVGISLAPSKVNHITNPSFETNTSGWTAVNATATAVADSVEIPTQYAGTKRLQLASTAATAVALSTTSAGAVTGPSDVTLSAFLKSATVPAAGYTATVEAYVVEPARNYVTDPTPTGASTGWSFSSDSGTFTPAYGTIAGNAYAGLSYSASPTTGDIEVAIAASGLTSPTLVGGAEYVYRVAVYCNAATTVWSTISWSTTETGADFVADNSADANIPAGTWTILEFITTAPFGVDDISLHLTSAAASAADPVTLFAVGDVELSPVTYTKTATWAGTNAVWERESVTLTIPEDVVIPASAGGMSVLSTISYTSNGADVLVDAVQLETTSTPTDYFDGGFYNAYWEGTEGDSASHMYGNLDPKLTRIQGRIRDWLPMGTPFYIETTSGVEFDGAFKHYA